MDLKEKIDLMHEQISCPVFVIRHEHVVSANWASVQHGINVGVDIKALIYTGYEDYVRFKRGTLYITVRVNQVVYNATVVRRGISDTFILDSDFVAPHYTQIHQLSAHLRRPLSDAMLCLSKLCEDPELKEKQFMLQLKQNIYKLHRSLCNMTAQPDYDEERKQLPHNQDLTEHMLELMIQTQSIIKKAGYKLKYAIPTRHIICSLDWNVFRHAILNMIANATKFSAPSKTIYLKMVKYDNYCTISVTNSFKDPIEIDKFDLFTIYSHDPFCPNGAAGAGLGLNVMRSAAMDHDGSLLMERPDPNTMRLTISIPAEIRALNTNHKKLHTFIETNYTGGYNVVLTELADLLPPEAFK